ncbi:MAG: arginine deiminase family protein [Thermoplasmata archaeon]
MIDSVQQAEWDPLREVVIHRPGIESFFGLLEPYAFLYEHAFSLAGAIEEHRALEQALTDAGIQVHRLARWVIGSARRHPELVDRIRARVLETVQYTGPKDLVRSARETLRRSIDRFDAESLFTVLFLRPTIQIDRRAGARVFLPRVRLDSPLANLYFLRDQQALTARGFVFGRMSKPQRRDEPALTSLVLRAMGVRVAGAIRPPGTLEGGDFLPARSFALLGQGDRTNRSGVEQFLRLPTGFAEIAVVHQPAHPLIPGNRPDPMVDMHLDTFLNFPGEGIAVGAEALLRVARVEVFGPLRRGGRRRDATTVPLYDFLRSRGFTIVPLSTLEQIAYASNFLCLGDRKILSFDVGRVVPRVLESLAAAARHDPMRYAALLEQCRRDRARLTALRQFFPSTPALIDLGVQVRTIRLEELTGGYGAAHCMTCVLRRDPPAATARG